jgi:hypothetical protein
MKQLNQRMVFAEVILIAAAMCLLAIISSPDDANAVNASDIVLLQCVTDGSAPKACIQINQFTGASGTSAYVVPLGKVLVITDIEWRSFSPGNVGTICFGLGGSPPLLLRQFSCAPGPGNQGVVATNHEHLITGFLIGPRQQPMVNGTEVTGRPGQRAIYAMMQGYIEATGQPPVARP